MILQFLWCARCSTAFTFTATRVEHAQGGKIAIRRLECGALNEIAPNGMSERDPSPRKRQRATSGAAYLKRRILITPAHGFCLRCRWARPA